MQQFNVIIVTHTKCVSWCSLVFQSIGTCFWCFHWRACAHPEDFHWRACAHLWMHTISLSIVFVFCAGKKILQPTTALETCKVQQLASMYTDKDYPLETENFLLLLCRLTRKRLKLGNKLLTPLFDNNFNHVFDSWIFLQMEHYPSYLFHISHSQLSKLHQRIFHINVSAAALLIGTVVYFLNLYYYY